MPKEPDFRFDPSKSSIENLSTALETIRSPDLKDLIRLNTQVLIDLGATESAAHRDAILVQLRELIEQRLEES